MANRRKKKISALPAVVTKHHLELPYKRGEFALETAVDPDDQKQKVTRLRRKCVYDEMLNRGSINQDQRDAAERYAILCEKSFGGSGDLYAKINLLKEGIHGHYDGPTLKQSEAYDKLFKIWEEMGRYHRDILNMIVLGNMSTKEISERKRLNLHYTMGQVLSTFILLEEAMKDL
ncbi:hypothetical protein HK18_01330 [Commensalibacter intestini]|uniref:Uncharacterized protein n=1 Tax=Commensalibacter intestini TaxID=479936 RepID=A0A251ZT16_9PROT|nr:hypothetical protein [Commensalibacter intestini]OUI77805.1 hypothetical protein HK18_01330 [Commensalibacter intestini]